MIKLGLNAEGLNADKANKSSESIRAQVKGLNEDLKGVESTLRTVGSQFAGFGKAAKMNAGVGQARAKPATQNDPSNVIQSPGKPFIPKIIVPEKDDQKDEKKKKPKEPKMPTSFGGALTSLGGQLGSLAAGVYLLKNTIDGAVNIISSFMEVFKSAMAEKNAAAVSGLEAQDVDFFKSVGAQFGDLEGNIAKNMVRFGQTKVSATPGEYHLGLANMGIAPLNANGGTRDTMELLKEVSAKAQKMDRNSENTYRYFAKWFEFDKTTVDMLQEGPKFLDKMPAEYRAQMLSKSNANIDRGAQSQVETALGAQKLSTIKDKSMIGGWDFMSNHPEEILGGAGGIIGAMIGDYFTSKTQGSSVPVKPTAAPYQGASNGNQTGHIENMTVNVAVNKDGSASASVAGYNARRVMVNPAPYKVAS